jgi:hypothetical protein
MTEDRCKVIDGTLQESIHKLYSLQDESVVLFNDTVLGKELFTNYSNILDVKINKPIKKIESTLFESSFIFNDHFYERVQVSPLFLPYLEKLLTFYEKNKINYRVKNFIPLSNFNPVYINSNSQVSDFGSTPFVTIFESNSLLLKKEYNFLHKECSWANWICCIDNTLLKEFNNLDNIFIYHDNHDLVELVKQNQYNFILIYNRDSNFLQNSAFDIKMEQGSLF